MSPAGGAATTDVWLVEDNDLYRRSTAAVIRASPDLSCSLAVGSCEEALAGLDEGRIPDLVLMDIGLPGMSGIEGARRVRTLSPTTRVVMLTVYQENEKIFEAICAGASGYLLKPVRSAELLEAIRRLNRGEAPIDGRIAKRILQLFSKLAPRRSDPDRYGLSPREREILQLLVDGMTMKQVGARLGVSYHTVTTHVRHIYDKLHVRTRGGAVSKAVREGLV